MGRSYHHGDLRAALIAAGIEGLDAGGGLEPSLREMARRVGVTPTAVYRHFKSKDALLGAIAAEGFAELATAFETAESQAAEAGEKLTRMGESYVAFAHARPNLFRLMFGGAYALNALRGDRCRIGGEAFDGLLASVARSHGTRIDDPGVLRHAVRVWSIVHGYAMLSIDGRLPPIAETTEFLGEMLHG
jgi:AcrR family transcriptional regulator